MNITLLQQGGIGGTPEFTSPPFTPNPGDCVLVVWSIQGDAMAAGVSLTTPGYTWVNTPMLLSTDTDITMGAAYALNVFPGAATFHTTGVGYSGWTYFVFDISGVTAEDQLGTAITPNPPGGPAAEITTAGPLAATGEAAVAWQQTQYTAAIITAMPGWTTIPVQQTNTAFGPNNGLAAWNANAGTAAQPLTGGWSSVANASGNGLGGQAMLITFKGAGGGAGAQPGFPRSAAIEEPSEGMQESNVTPPDMGTPN